MERDGQVGKINGAAGRLGKGVELVIPNPKLKLMDQVREVMRVRHYTHVLRQGGAGMKSPLDCL